MSGLARAAASLLLAVVLAAAIMLAFVPWVIEVEMLPYVVPYLLRPSTGFLSLVLVLFLAIWLPLGLPAARLAASMGPDGSAARGSRPDLPTRPDVEGKGTPGVRPDPQARQASSGSDAGGEPAPWIRASTGFRSASSRHDHRDTDAPPETVPADAVEIPADAVEIPVDAVTALDARRRLEMARALDVPWDGRLARDDEAWLRACTGGLRRAARRDR